MAYYVHLRAEVFNMFAMVMYIFFIFFKNV